MTDRSYLKKLADMQTQIKELVPDSSEPVRHGHWKRWDEDDYGDTYECTSCGEFKAMRK